MPLSPPSSSDWTTYQTVVAVFMVITGTINTISVKWADNMVAANSQGVETHFNHPFFQADCMFVGEMACMVAFYILLCFERRSRKRHDPELQPSEESSKFPVYIFYVPAFCDMLATSTMYLGLTLTYASSFQMLRGAVIVFTGLLSVAFLNRTLHYFQWLGIVGVIIGLVIVGISDFLGSSETDLDPNGIITGDLLIVAAQIVTACQMVVEEKFIGRYRVPPLQVVGWEGIFGFITLTILLIPFYWIPAGVFSGNPRGVLEDVNDAFIQLGSNPVLIAAILGNVISIAFFNFAGVSVTKELSATTRMVLDSVRTLFVWLFSLALGWQKFQYLQPIGFIVLIIGMFLYNDVIILPTMRKHGCLHDGFGEEDQESLQANAEGTNVDNTGEMMTHDDS